MKKKDKQTIFQTDAADLAKQVHELNLKLASLSINRYTNQSKNIRERKNLRGQVAVIKTVIRIKELENGKV
jgi:ribosomal protein L29